ncbi:uncharacterized protein LOC130238764, partial [Danio aesculapii]|uniref:uncharacterized protein LOC130238764 n=1 Tax=Danio aesculapii TaxID=1142201 RepID=UPI0024BFB01F
MKPKASSFKCVIPGSECRRSDLQTHSRGIDALLQLCPSVKQTLVWDHGDPADLQRSNAAHLKGFVAHPPSAGLYNLSMSLVQAAAVLKAKSDPLNDMDRNELSPGSDVAAMTKKAAHKSAPGLRCTGNSSTAKSCLDSSSDANPKPNHVAMEETDDLEEESKFQHPRLRRTGGGIQIKSCASGGGGGANRSCTSTDARPGDAAAVIGGGGGSKAPTVVATVTVEAYNAS